MPSAPSDVILKGDRVYNEVIHMVAQQTGALYIDTRTFGLRGSRFYDEGDPVHFNPEGADAIGRNLARRLIDAGVIDSTSMHGTAELERSGIGDHPRADLAAQ